MHYFKVITAKAIFKESHTDAIITTTSGYNKSFFLCLKNNHGIMVFYHCSSSFSCSPSMPSPIWGNHFYANAA